MVSLNSAKSRIAIAGIGCRLPGAADEAAFRALLTEGRCAVTSSPAGRWSVERFLHPRTTEPGFSYSFAGGYLDDPFAFDPTVFGISPREAEQIDPQQRLLLEVVWEALENARIVPSATAGSEIGVYVGASSLDHGNLHASDPASIDSHFMTGNTLSVVANRISYIFDWRGPSFTVDTACSSSLVALAQALSDLRSGRVDTAVVAGVNILLSPASYVGFSRASMLSPTGLCRPFSAEGDGYVRAEGAVALVLKRADVDLAMPARAWILDADVNSDGRTSGIALPGLGGQTSLLERIYGELGLTGDDLAFVEAHGTGTRVGDPIEATAIGRVLGQMRKSALPIGSVKSNIGHLEPASGVAGLLKAVHALESRRLPATLHIDALNPLIDFDDLGLAPVRRAIDLDPRAETLLCGVSNFGFGGTNAHVVLESAVRALPAAPTAAAEAKHLTLSAASRDALVALARDTAAILADGVEPYRFAAALAAGRDTLKHRLTIPLEVTPSPGEALIDFVERGANDAVVEGVAVSRHSPVCFVFGGNGAQWIGFGRTALRCNAAFRQRFETIDRAFGGADGRSLIADLDREDIAEQFAYARFVQPLLFAIQSSTAAALIAEGLVPDMVLGHSIGELAAAEVAGRLDLASVVRLIETRAICQETVHGLGSMAALAASRAATEELIASLGDGSVEIAAENGPNSVTVTGTLAGIERLRKISRKRRVAARQLEIEYPFHSSRLDPVRADFLAGIGEVRSTAGPTVMISSVTGEAVADDGLDADYWWHNFRDEVRFRTAVAAAGTAGAEVFVEISPRPILQSPIADTLKDLGLPARVIHSLAEADDRTPDRDPIAMVVARALANGAALVTATPTQQPPADPTIALPVYPWQRRAFHFHHTSERLDVVGIGDARHPLIGGRLAEGQPEWRTLIDSTIVPYLADHVVDGETVVPGAAFAEMLLAVARDLQVEGPIGFTDLDILQPMMLPADGMREVSIRHSILTRTVEIWSRPRFGPNEWSLHARGRLATVAHAPHPMPAPQQIDVECDGDTVYALARVAGIDYGPAFRLVRSMRRDRKTMLVELSPPQAGTGAFTRPQILHPASLDATLHSLFQLVDIDPTQRTTYMPVRFRRLDVFVDRAVVHAAVLQLESQTKRSLTASVWLLDGDGNVVAEAGDILMRAVVLSRSDQDDVFFRASMRPASALRAGVDLAARLARLDIPAVESGAAPLLLRAHLRAVAHEAMRRLAGRTPRIDLDAAVALGRLAPEALTYATTLVAELIAGNLAEERDGVLTLAATSGLPAPARILTTFAAEAPGASAELLLVGRTMAEIGRHLATGEPIAHRRVVIDQFEASGLIFATLRAAAKVAVAETIAEAAPRVPRIVLAEADCRGLLADLLPSVLDGRIELALAGFDALRLEQVVVRLPDHARVDVLDLSQPGVVGRHERFDLALVHAMRGGDDLDRVIAALVARLGPGGAVVVGRPPRDPLLDFIHGTTPGWFDRSLAVDLPTNPLPSDAEFLGALAGCGAVVVQDRTAEDGTRVLTARPPAQSVATRLDGRVFEFTDITVDTGLRDDLETSLVEAGAKIDTSGKREGLCLIGRSDDGDRVRVERAIAGLVAAIDGETPPTRLWIVLATDGADVDPVLDAIRGFTRVLLNERSDIAVHTVEWPVEADRAAAIERLVELFADPLDDHEIRLSAEGAEVLHIEPGLPQTSAASRPEALTLEFPRLGMIDRFSWRPIERRAPERGEIEIEVIATGLNFRDVMLAMGLLDDDILEGGLAGEVFGFECVGRVLRRGAAVTDVGVGSVVFGFAAPAFSTHVTAPREVFVPLPAGVEPEAAASIPVAFLTAWYGLIELAKLKRGEKVLIHGAAGGVGLAAVQIARARGAEVIATVSTPDKRMLVELYGARHVYDSRSLGFADAIREELGGVDVVLNSLAGDAMRESIACLNPFGRFVELGKRDYVANTELGLRPFRRNLQYFGVDVDQLVARDPRLVSRGLKHLLAGFDSGRYTVLPHRLFDAADLGAAFRLMQGAGHVGKILVRPPRLDGHIAAPRIAGAFEPGDGVQLVVGGTGGFGFATAAWLASKGARRIVVASRRGRVEAALEATVAEARANGVDFAIESVDVTDLASVEALVARVVTAHGPITGVYHTAMVLDDALIAHLDMSRLDKVLAPKIDGALHLDRATRGQPIETFVLFSSATTLIGNPGQAAYVAANAHLEGVARRRRAEGLPALAVGWGAISDVGVMTRDANAGKLLRRKSGVVGMTSAEALAWLDVLLARRDEPIDPVVHCAQFHRIDLLSGLPMVATPAFRTLFGGDGGGDEGNSADLQAMIEGKSDAEVLDILGSLIAAEVATILRLPAKEVDLDRPLVELGLDSLMALELRMSVETKYGVDLPLVAITSVKNLRDLARRMAKSLRGSGTEVDDRVDETDRSLIAIHGGDQEAFVGTGEEFDTYRERLKRVT